MSLFGHWRQTLQTSGLFCVLQRSLWAAQPCKNIVRGARWTEGSSIRSASPWTAHWQGVRRCVHGSPAAQGLEEFFPKEDPIEEGENTGRQWEARELRQKSNEDLHKLWYVLLKERNMLMTVKHEAGRLGFIMPAPERMWKVRKSMARIKVVLGERERAIEKAKEALKAERQKRRQQEQSESEPSSHVHSVAQL